jgi:hypothetical protein
MKSQHFNGKFHRSLRPCYRGAPLALFPGFATSAQTTMFSDNFQDTTRPVEIGRP